MGATRGGRLEGKVAVITGGGNGIGRATAIRFAAEGAAVVVADVQIDRAREVADGIEEGGGRAVAAPLDAVSATDNERVAALAVERFDALDILVTAAGISHAEYSSGDLEAEVKLVRRSIENAEQPWRGFLDEARESWQRVLDVNLTGTMLAMQACAERMVERGSGSIITLASIAAKDPDAGPLAYTVSKAGVWMLTKKAARMLGPAGVRVNAIGPGFIRTNMTRIFDELPAERRELMDQRIPLGRRGEPEEIASVALFLASDDASYVTGELLHPDGGWFTD